MVSNDDSRKQAFIDIDRMVNEGLGGGQVTPDNGLIGDSTTDTLKHPEFVIHKNRRIRLMIRKESHDEH